MELTTVPLSPRAMFERVDNTEWIDYASVQGVASRWHVLGPMDGSAYYLVPAFGGPAGCQSTARPTIRVAPTTFPDGTGRDEKEVWRIRSAYANAAFQAALGIANALASESVLIESLA